MEWIPITERQPEKDGYYLVTESYQDYDELGSWVPLVRMEIGLYSGGGWGASDEVFAWMPLPKRYRKGRAAKFKVAFGEDRQMQFISR